MSQLNPGVCEKMSERRIRAELPDEVTKHEADPYHHRYPRAEVSRTKPFSKAFIPNAREVLPRFGRAPGANNP